MRISDWSSDVCSSDLVRIQGDEIAVRARLRKTEIYSGHADHDELLAWLRDRLPVRRGLMLTHGDADAIGNLRAAIAQWGADAPHMTVPRLDETYTLTGAHPKQIGRDHARTSGTNAHLVYRYLLQKKKQK